VGLLPPSLKVGLPPLDFRLNINFVKHFEITSEKNEEHIMIKMAIQEFFL